MATRAHRLFKIALFIGLYLLSIRYLPFSNVWSPSEARVWFAVSDWLGVSDPDNLYFVTWLAIELIVAVLVYVVIVRLWRHYRSRASRRTKSR